MQFSVVINTVINSYNNTNNSSNIQHTAAEIYYFEYYFVQPSVT